ncbi:kinase [Novosphingobium sp. JCM 18896]|uniref:kinase n=1 Tax=Novosphingobium sp. JCM 18896 TaxID=2989731 RepID=UPI0022221240|nr:kinase [Novosphingobium sp. JCM 18896]MCW1428313.1 kinase [Novosphingobium sp. JCM 18896]
MAPDPRLLAAIFAALGQGGEERPLVLGLCGAQGSGKTTLAQAVAEEAQRRGIATATLSIDDLYLTRAERERLGQDVHPLLRTRGVPGTHDVALGLEVLAALDRGEPARLPRFDKARDDRRPEAEWDRAPANTELLILEGWCVGAHPEDPAALRDPVNALEASEDPDGLWRSYANVALAGVYQELFARIDVLVLLAAPGFDVVFDWRLQQEAELRESAGPDAPGLMDAAGVARFIAHYERLTRHILTEMPGRTDLVVRLGLDRSVLSIG